MDEIVSNNAGKDEKGKEVRTLGEMKLDHPIVAFCEPSKALWR
jgi:hypothetical protein